MTRHVKIILANASIIGLLCGLIFNAATWWRMQNQLTLGDEAYRRGDFTGAVAGYESALHMYIPFHPAMEHAANRLWNVAEYNEGVGDITRALIAYRSLRSSFYAAHWLKTPGQEWIRRCDMKIAALAPLQRER